MKRSFYLWMLAALVFAGGGARVAAAPSTNEVTVGGSGSPVKLNIKIGSGAPMTNSSVVAGSGIRVHVGNTSSASVQPWISVGKDVDLKEGKTANEVVVIGRDATIAGKVRENVVVVLGAVTLKPTAVIGGDIVAVGGTIHAASNAVVRGNVVAVGGGIDAEPGFKPGGDQVNVGLPGIDSAGLSHWVKDDLLRGVLLPWSALPTWIFVAVMLAFNLLLSLLFPRSLQTCTDMAREKPAQSFLLGLLLLAALGPVCLLFVISCVGVLAIPFLFFAVLAALVFGFIAVYRVVGRPLTQSGGGAEQPLLALLVGTVICNLAYMLPVVGLLAWGLVMTLGFGAASLAVFGRPGKQGPLPPPSMTPPVITSQPVMMVAPPVIPPAATRAVPAVVASPLEVTALPRPGFWMRLGAAVLDCILISMVASFVGVRQGEVTSLLLMIYLVGLWTWRGTTIGNIIFGLKIVRTDGQPVTLGVAIVRALASLLSLAVMGFGFFWIGWDREKQAWHDKIAGTLVVRMPKGVTLI